MRIGFFVNDVMTELAAYTTIRLAMAATNRGHEVWLMGAGDLAYDPDGTISARARRAPAERYTALDNYLRHLQGPKAIAQRICVDGLDVLLLRNDPAVDAKSRPWAQNIGVIFGRMAMRHGVIVLNDPDGLSQAMNKMYLEYFPEEVRAKTLITRDHREIKAFSKEMGTIVLKPLQGSGGESVFLVRPDDVPNINQMIDAVTRDGFVVAQEYLPAAEGGDTRLFLMNGSPLMHRGKYAAFRRLRHGGDMRSNIHAGGTKAEAEVDRQALELAEMVRPKLVEDGMFLVGLDIVGDKLMEINVFSPGGLGSAQKFEKVNFANAVIAGLERKVKYMSYYRRNFGNVRMATL